MSLFRLPSLTDRTAVMGMTGSGKTQFGFWQLTVAPFDLQPFIIFDYKGESLFRQSERVKEIGIGELPREPGVYRVSLVPRRDDEAVENYLWKIWEHENVGALFDEAYML